jgi:hypothetical protein
LRNNKRDQGIFGRRAALKSCLTRSGRSGAWPPIAAQSLLKVQSAAEITPLTKANPP